MKVHQLRIIFLNLKKFDEEDLVLILLCSLSRSFEHFINTILFGRDILCLEDVKALLNSKKLKKNVFENLVDQA